MADGDTQEQGTADGGSDAASLAPSPPSRRRMWMLIGLAAVVVAVIGAVVFATRPDDSNTVATGGPVAADGVSEGEVTVQLAQTDGFYIEGFEVGLRFETADGDVIASTLWSDVVESAEDPSIDDYYDAVLHQPVPAGTVVVRAQIEIGPGGPPAVPDLAGEMACELTVEVAADATKAVEVVFEQGDDCLREALNPVTSTSAAEPGATTAPPDPADPVTSPTVPPDVVGTSGPPVVTTEPTTATTAPATLQIGVGYSVDVDLDCEAFELGGTWVLVDGDVRSWQPAGERHEGGTLTLDSATTGTFRGDAQGTKVATFRVLGVDEQPDCRPVPR